RRGNSKDVRDGFVAPILVTAYRFLLPCSSVTFIWVAGEARVRHSAVQLDFEIKELARLMKNLACTHGDTGIGMSTRGCPAAIGALVNKAQAAAGPG
ncbi:MAG: hypothetical protein ABSB74_16385, partial [Tepidisphaeraceae bacterium]